MSSSSSNDKSRRRPVARKAAPAKPDAPAHAKTGLIGLGLDNTDGHKRVTTGAQFAIVGGSEETHARMTETVVKTFEELKHRGKQLSQVERTELAEIIHKATPQ